MKPRVHACTSPPVSHVVLVATRPDVVVTHLVRMGSHPLITTTGEERVPHAKFARLSSSRESGYETTLSMHASPCSESAFTAVHSLVNRALIQSKSLRGFGEGASSVLDRIATYNFRGVSRY